MKKRMRQLTTTLIFKYTCSVWRELGHVHVHVYMYIHIRIILSHMYTVYSTQYWIILPVVVYTRTCSNKVGVLRRKVASSPGAPPHKHTLILDLVLVEK